MSDVLTYKGYSARVEFDADDRLFFGRLAGIQDGIGFHADNVAGLEAAFREAVDDYLKTCARVGKIAGATLFGQSDAADRPVVACAGRGGSAACRQEHQPVWGRGASAGGRIRPIVTAKKARRSVPASLVCP